MSLDIRNIMESMNCREPYKPIGLGKVKEWLQHVVLDCNNLVIKHHPAIKSLFFDPEPRKKSDKK